MIKLSRRMLCLMLVHYIVRCKIENDYIVWNNVMLFDDPLWSIMMCDARLRMFILSGTMLCLMMVHYGQLCGVMQD